MASKNVSSAESAGLSSNDQRPDTANTGACDSASSTAPNRRSRSHHHGSSSMAEHDWSFYYLNTYLRRRGYALRPRGSAIEEKEDAAEAERKAMQHVYDDDSDDEDESAADDDDIGAQWEEWTHTQRARWLTSFIHDFTEDCKTAYVLPTAGRTLANDDISTYGGYGGIALMLFRLFEHIDAGVPRMLSSHRRTAADIPLAMSPTAHKNSTEMIDAASVLVRDEKALYAQFVHSQQQYSMGLLDSAYKYLEYVLGVIALRNAPETVPHDGDTEHATNTNKRDRRPSLVSEHHKKETDISFLMGPAGIHALAAVLYHHRARYLYAFPVVPHSMCSLGNMPMQAIKLRNKQIETLIAMKPPANTAADDAEKAAAAEELLYGRVGYLFALVFAYNKLSECLRLSRDNTMPHSTDPPTEAHSGEGPLQSPPRQRNNTDREKEDAMKAELETTMRHGDEELEEALARLKDTVKAVFTECVTTAERTAKAATQVVASLQVKPPLLVQWHNKYYLGAAHGLVGVADVLLQALPLVQDDGAGKVIVQTADFLLSQLFPSCNLPSSIGNGDDRLVQWCHGAAGFVPFLVRVYQRTREERFLQSAIACSEVVWRRGLLKKGGGLCHGISGNAYAFLSLYQCTDDDVHLKRAWHFARFFLDKAHQKVLRRQPERPNSLYEGLAGAVCFFSDIYYAETQYFEFPGANVAETIDRKTHASADAQM